MKFVVIYRQILVTLITLAFGSQGLGPAVDHDSSLSGDDRFFIARLIYLMHFT
jgi:hypothetical protein